MESVRRLLKVNASAERLHSPKGTIKCGAGLMKSPFKFGTAILSQSAYSILVGQVLSVLIASTGAATTLLNQYTGNSVMPAAQNCPNYVIMSLFLLYSPTRARLGYNGGGNAAHEAVDTAHKTATFLAYTSESESASSNLSTQESAATEVTNDVWWQYALLACVDVEANVVFVWAYRYTSITSAMLLDCSTIPFVMLLSWLVLGAHYTWQHFAGALLCFCGVLTIVLSDMLDGSTSTSGKV